MLAKRFRRKTLALFLLTSLSPALVVGAIWYLYTSVPSTSLQYLDLNSFVLPAMMVGVIPAVVLSMFFSELLTEQVRKIHASIMELAKGNFDQPLELKSSDFPEIGAALQKLGIKLQEMLSQASTETEVIASERGKLRSVLNSMTDGVFALDGEGRVILFNKAASLITGHSMEEVAGQLAEKVMPFRQNGELVMARWLASHPGTENKIGQWKALELYHADGSSLFVDVQAVVLTEDPNGIGALITFHDITKQQQLEQMKIDFVALAAHELRTPLTEIKGYLDIFQSESKGVSKSKLELVQKAIESSDKLSGLIHNLLSVARIEHGEPSHQHIKLDYREFIETTIKELKDRAPGREKNLTLEVSHNLPRIWGDPASLREVIINLVDNAYKFSDTENAEVDVSVKVNGDNVETSVTDNGCGIPEDAMSHLFTKFFRVNELESSTRGTGLGLYICKSIVEAHYGTISAESKVGKGSTFTFTLPTGTVAHKSLPDNNDKVTIAREAHGWIKEDSFH